MGVFFFVYSGDLEVGVGCKGTEVSLCSLFFGWMCVQGEGGADLGSCAWLIDPVAFFVF